MKELWVDINGFEGLYQVSNKGNIKSLSRYDEYLRCGKLTRRPRKEKLLKFKIDKYGYFTVCLRKDNKNHYFTVHRLVANNFLLNPESKPTVNHIDGDKLNNNVSNLEFATVSENTKHAYDTGLFTVTRDEKGRWCNNHGKY